MSASRTVSTTFDITVKPGWTVRVEGVKQSYTFLRFVQNGDSSWIECVAPNGANRAFEVERVVAVERPKQEDPNG